MKKIYLFLTLALCCATSFGQNVNVFYGERNLETTTNNIYFDKIGNVYPKYFIANKDLENCNANLKEWYSKHEDNFITISKSYNCIFKSFTEDNLLRLNDAIVLDFVNRPIYKKSKTVAFFIHGFRKPFVSMNHDSDSPNNFETFNATYLKYGNKNAIIVNIYWDALYDCCFSTNSKKNNQLFHLFELSQINAGTTGLAFNKLLLKTTSDTINIITHSLGARVALFATLNINKTNYKTPENKTINLCLIAPAIDSKLISENYYSRNSSIDFKKTDNYHLSIIYNEKDFVLRKKDPMLGVFGPGPFKFGNTTLGCNHNKAALKLEKHFKINFPNSEIKLFNFSFVNLCHHISCYCYNNNLKTVFEELKN